MYRVARHGDGSNLPVGRGGCGGGSSSTCRSRRVGNHMCAALILLGSILFWSCFLENVAWSPPHQGAVTESKKTLSSSPPQVYASPMQYCDSLEAIQHYDQAHVDFYPFHTYKDHQNLTDKYPDRCHERGRECMTIVSSGGRLFVSAIYKTYQSRVEATLRHLYAVSQKFKLQDACIHLLLDDGWPPNDNELVPWFQISKQNHTKTILYPDFTFFSWPESRCPGEKSHAYSYLYDKFLQMAYETSWYDKKPILFWRGSPIGQLRIQAVDAAARINNATKAAGAAAAKDDENTPNATKAVAPAAAAKEDENTPNATKAVAPAAAAKEDENTPNTTKAVAPAAAAKEDENTPKLDMDFMTWQANGMGKSNKAENCVSLTDACSNKYQVYLRGHTYSSRLKYLLLCQSTVLSPNLRDKKHDQFMEWWTERLTPNQDYLVVSHDFVDLEDTWKHVLAHPEKSQQVATSGFREASRRLNPEAVACYWRRLFDLAHKHLPMPATPLPDNALPMEDVLLLPQHSQITRDGVET